MTTRPMLSATAAALFALTLSLPAAAYISGDGKGKPETDCFIGLEGYSPSDMTPFGKKGKPAIQCTDGDACDLDGTVNGSCMFSFAAAVNQSGVAGCTPAPLKKIVVKAKTKGTKLLSKNGDFGTLPLDGSSAIGSMVDFPVLVKKYGKPKPKPGKGKVIELATKPKDKDKFLFVCNPSGSATTTTTIPFCQNNTDGDGLGPRQLTMVVNTNGPDLDNGTSGQSHNFPVPEGTTLSYCLTGCDSTNPICNAEGSTGGQKGVDSLNGAYFGPPLPLFSAGVPVCVVNEYKTDASGNPMPLHATVNVDTGEFVAMQGTTDTPVVLNSRIYQCQTNLVCPKCGANGRCQGGARDGQRCTVEGSVVVNNPPTVVNATYPLSSDCPPGGNECQFYGAIEVRLGLTTGTSTLAADAAGSFPCPNQSEHDECMGGSTCTVDCSPDGGTPVMDPKGGVSQYCCSSSDLRPCFPTSPAAGSLPIVRTGETVSPTPLWSSDPTSFPKMGTGKLVATFCEAASNSNLINSTAGIPGPGALILPGDTTWDGNTAN